MLISDIMNSDVVTVAPDDTVALAARLLARHNVGSLPVCGGDGRLRGIVTDRDIVLRCVAGGGSPSSTRVRDVMSRSVITVSPDDDAKRASELMSGGQVRRLPVVQGEKLVGMLALGDLAHTAACHDEAFRALADISENVRRL